MSVRLEKNTILERLSDRKRRDPQFEEFGASVHRYELQKPLDEAQLVAFESTHGVVLPEDYRYFITRVGNGGAGPHYGLFPFGFHDDIRGYCSWEDGHMVGDLASEFAHQESWNLPASFWDKMPDPGPDISLDEEDRMMEKWEQELVTQYWNPAIMNGAIPICHLGCALRQWLVINGPQRGFVWVDNRVDHTGICPLTNENQQRMTFADWYVSWLQKTPTA